MSKPQIAFVRWVDSSQTEPGWTAIDSDWKDDPLECHSVGYVVHKNDKILVMANSRNTDNDDVEGIYSIPTCAVLEMRFLEV